MTHQIKATWSCRAATLGAALVALARAAWLPSALLQHDAARWLAPTQDPQQALARSVNRNLSRVDRASFSTGSALFDGEWTFGTSVMAAIGNAQLGLSQPTQIVAARQAADAAIQNSLLPATRAFDAERWGADPLDDPNLGHAHLAYLGYLNLALSLRSALGASSPDALGERITARMLDQLEATDDLLLETYPGEYYPVDNAMAIASIALRNQTRGLQETALAEPSARSDHATRRDARERAMVRRWVARCRSDYVDPKSGLLLQSVPGGRAAGANAAAGALPRGSGTALAAFALNYVDSGLSAELQAAAARELLRPVLGFGVLQEFPDYIAARHRRGDIDSGPLIAGYSISASGFMLGASLAHADARSARSLLATFSLLGGLTSRGDGDGQRLSFVSGGPLADAIMLAMLTAPQHDQLPRLLRRSLGGAS